MERICKQTLGMPDRKFYSRDTTTVARALLGKRIMRRFGPQMASAIITETEAYGHEDDPASHAFRGRTPRNQAMFGQVGQAYVYFTYGMHYCFNIVAKSPRSKAGAVLIRAAVPESGIDIMLKNRGNRKNISDGPAKLAQALDITKELYGADLTTGTEIYIADGIKPDKILAGSRVGISQATDKLWNFKAG